jgi:hypothetical protein
LLICDQRAQGDQPLALLRNGFDHQLAVIGPKTEVHPVKDVCRIEIDQEGVYD